MIEKSNSDLLFRIQELENRLEESESLIEAIKTGEVDAFAIINNEESEVFTLQSGDYAYRLLIEEFGEGAINVTEEGLIVYTNNYFFDLLKLPYEKVIGATFNDFVHSDSKIAFQILFQASLSGKSKGEINLFANATIIPVYISLTSLQPKLSTVGIIITDLTEKKRNENIILEYQKELESKNDQLEEINKELQSFTYVASHDLQEPLRKIQTFAIQISEKEFLNLSEKGRDQFQRMYQAAKRMQTLIEDLLVYSRTNSTERKFEKIHLNSLVNEVKEDIREELQQKNATIETGNMCEATIIHFQFKQLLNNLISNSLKFCDVKKTPHIKIDSAIVSGDEFKNDRFSKETHYCHISIADNGIGFEAQYKDKIFEVFQRLHGKAEYNGTGIGLSIVKKIVENHNGIITATGDVNKGATFDIYIPVK